MAVKQYIAYYRVSTVRQGLGLDAQREAVRRYIEPSAEIIAEYAEKESGKHDNRPALEQAVREVRETGAVLLIAKLDRLSRSVSFIFRLKESGVPFECADMPDLNTLNIGIVATLAQHERELISKRTKEALAAKKRQGFALGTPANLTDAARLKAVEANRRKARENRANIQATELIRLYLKDGLNQSQIAEKLNDLGYTTSRGKRFTNVQIGRLARRAGVI